MSKGDDNGGRYTTPYALYALLGTLILATVLFLILYLTGGLEGIVRTTFLSLLGLYGTLGGAYFGIKSSSDSADRSAAGRRKAEAIAKEALVDLPPEKGERIKNLLEQERVSG